jgi:hypothetical protein
MRSLVFCMALLAATTAAAQSQPRLEIGNRQGNYYWVVETAPDGSRRGGWVSVSVPIDAIDRKALKPLPSVSPLAAVETPTQAPPTPPSIDERLARIEQSLAGNQTVRQEPQAVRSAPLPQVSQPRPDVAAPATHPQTREGFWFNAGMGYGSAGCNDCLFRVDGFSGGLSLGGTISPRVLLGVGTSGFYRAELGETMGTLDARLRFYPSLTSGFFITGGFGLGHVSDGYETVWGPGAVVGLGWDVRVGRNVSLTPFWNGFAMSSEFVDRNVGQLGLGVTIH